MRSWEVLVFAWASGLLVCALCQLGTGIGDKDCGLAPHRGSDVFKRPEDDAEMIAEAERLIHSPAFLARIGQQVHQPRLMRFIEKLDKGNNITVAVFGGSMVYGQRCAEGETVDIKCCYAARIAKGLENISRSKLQLFNYAVGGTSTEMWVPKTSSTIRSTISSGSPDLIIIDFSVNDHQLADTLQGYNRLLAAHEVILRNFLRDFPDATVLQVHCYPSFGKYRPNPTPYSHGLAYQTAASYYGITMIDFIGMYRQVSPPEKKLYDLHAPWSIHELISKVTLQFVKEAWASYCETTAAVETVDRLPLPPPISSDELFQEFDSRVCNPFTRRYDASARTAQFVPGVSHLEPPLVLWKCVKDCNFLDGVKFESDCWSFRADVSWKMGWIAEHKQCSGTSIVFPLSFGERPRLIFTFLQTYEKISAVKLTMDGHEHEMTVVALNPHFHNSQAANVRVNLCVPGESNCDPKKEFVVHPHQSVDLRVTLLCDGFEYCKFKVLAVSAC